MKHLKTVEDLATVKLDGFEWSVTQYGVAHLYRGPVPCATIFPEDGPCADLHAQLARVCDSLNIYVVNPEPPPEGATVWLVTPSLPGFGFLYEVEKGVVAHLQEGGWDDWRLVLVNGLQAASPYRCERKPGTIYNRYSPLYFHTYESACRYVADRYQDEADDVAACAAAWRERAEKGEEAEPALA